MLPSSTAPLMKRPYWTRKGSFRPSFSRMASRSAAETEMPVSSRTGSPTFCFRAKPMKLMMSMTTMACRTRRTMNANMCQSVVVPARAVCRGWFKKGQAS